MADKKINQNENKVNEKIIILSDKMMLRGLKKANVGEISAAISELNNSVSLNKSNYKAYNLLGLCYYQIGEIPMAIKQWIISQNIKSDDNDASRYLELIKKNNSKFNAYSDSAIKYNKALELLKKDSGDIAIVNLKKAISLNKNFVSARLLLALAYYNLDKKSSAIKELKEVLRIDSSNLLARKYLKDFNEKEDFIVKETSDNDSAAYNLKPRPISNGVNMALNRFISVMLGVLIGGLIIYFAIVPAVKDAKDAEIEKKKANIERLSDRVSNLKTSLNDTQDKLNAKEAELLSREDKSEELNAKIIESRKLFKVFENYYFEEKDEKKAADILVSINEDLLDDEMRQVSKKVKDELLPNLASKTYFAAYKDYTRNNFDEAIKQFEETYKYQQSGDVAEKAIYYMARSYFKKGEKDDAKKYFEKLVNDFPKSSLVDDSQYFLGRLK